MGLRARLMLMLDRAILERLPEGGEDDHDVWSRGTEQREEDEAADDGGDERGD